MKYNNFLDNFEFEGSRNKVKVTEAIFSKSFSLLKTPLFGDPFLF